MCWKLYPKRWGSLTRASSSLQNPAMYLNNSWLEELLPAELKAQSRPGAMGRPPAAATKDQNDPQNSEFFQKTPKTNTKTQQAQSVCDHTHTLMNHSICIPYFLPLLYLISLPLTLSNLQALGNLRSLISHSRGSCSLT